MPPLLACFYRGIILGSGWPEAHYVCSSGTHLVRALHCQTPAEGSTTSSWLCQQGVQGDERPFRRPFGGLAWACLEHLSFQLRSRVSRSLCHENDPQYGNIPCQDMFTVGCLYWTWSRCKYLVAQEQSRQWVRFWRAILPILTSSCEADSKPVLWRNWRQETLVFKVMPSYTLSFETSLGYVRLFPKSEIMSVKDKKTNHFFIHLNQISNIQTLGQG